MTNNKVLPPGQRLRADFPRYGLWQYATAIAQLPTLSLELTADSARSRIFDEEKLATLTRVEQRSDFHCVTTWSAINLNWSGYRFSDFFQHLVAPELDLSTPPKYAIFRSADGYRTFMLMEDLLAADVMLADTLNGDPLGLDHGGPLRLVAPAHYGFKNAKHINQIHFSNDLRGYKPPAFHWHESQRGRVALEERGWPSAGFWRVLGRLAIPTVLYAFRRGEKKRHSCD